MKKLLFTLSVFLGVLNTINAQTDFKYCGFTEKYLTRLKTNPGIIQEQQNLENFTRSFELQKLTQKEQQTGPYIIPIVFHIIHQYGSENISDAQVLDEVRILNLDFRKLNADTTAIVPEFKGIAADANIEFRLAQKDPNGNCTNGIDRIASVQTNIGDDGSKLNPWDRKKYLNVWVVKTISSGAAGYAYYPSSVNGSPSIDGIIILSSYIGSVGTGNAVTSRALSHEIGHYLNLPHVWGDTNQPGVACGDDGVADTPVTKGYTSCTLNNAINCTPGVVENIQNYMEYAYCQNMFTAGQAIRMQAALNSSISGRSTLWSATNLTATGVDNVNPSVCSPKADFTPGNYTVICQGSAITFKDVSSNGTVTNRTWTFTGGTPATDTAKNATVTYAATGTYDVSLTASNASGSNTKTVTGKVIVVPSTTTNAPTYTMDFEDPSAYSSQIVVLNQDNDLKKWARFTTTGYNSSACVRMDAINSPVGAIDEFLIPSINLNGLTNVQITFYYSTKLRANDQTDKLRVLVSNNCGQTWMPRLTLSGTALAYTQTTQSATFTPTSSSMWKMATINLPGVYAKANTLIKFEYTSGDGNNFYIDNINVLGSGTVGINEISTLKNELDFGVTPNPFSSTSSIHFNLINGIENAEITVSNLLGQNVAQLYKGSLHAKEYSFNLSKEQLGESGVYFVKLRLDGQEFVQKLVVN